MKQAVLIHNPTAGSGDHKKEDLKKMISRAGYEVKYFSTNNPFWKGFLRKDADVIFVAGGDGTVQKVAAAMLQAEERAVRKIPVQILPCGTANNIATTLHLETPSKILEKTGREAGFDIGEVDGVEKASFFIEGMGCGMFPRLVQVMEAKKEEEKQNELKQSLEELLKIVESYEAQEAVIIADQSEISGKFLLIEVMNIRFIGPNFELAPNAEIGDGSFELVTIGEDAREDLKNYIKRKLSGDGKEVPLESFADLRKVKELRLKWFGNELHIDDHILTDYHGEEIQVKNRQEVFSFLIP